MGLTQKLGTIPLAIQTDSSNNVGIGGAANASYKLAVTGASLLTEDLRLYRSAATTTGYINFGSTGTNYFGWTGSIFSANGGMTIGGNTGIGISPNTSWGSIFSNSVLQLGNYGSYIAGRADGQEQIFLGTNAYYNGTNWIRTNGTYSARYYISGGAHNFETAASSTAGSSISYDSRMVITNAGNVGIGRSNPEFTLDVNGDIAFNRTNKLMFAGPVAGDRSRSYMTGDSSNNLYIYGPYSNCVSFFGASGNIGIGTTTPSYQVEMVTSANNSLLYVSQSNGAVGGNAAIIVNIETTGGYLMLFRYGQASKGSITTNGSAVAYNTTISDVRLKKNFEDWNENVLDLFKEIKPTLFNYLDDEDGKKKTKGYIAQQEVDKFPEAYTIDHEGYHSFNPSGMMEYAMKALKEAALRIEQLEAKITALENKS